MTVYAAGPGTTCVRQCTVRKTVLPGKQRVLLAMIATGLRSGLDGATVTLNRLGLGRPGASAAAPWSAELE